VAAHERSEASEQFVEVEGFDEVVVRAGVEAVDAVRDGAEGREEQDRRRDAGRADRRDEARPVEVGESPVDDHDVEPLGECAFEGVATVGDRRHLVRLAEHLDRHLCDDAIVLDIEQARCRTSSARLHPASFPISVTLAFIPMRAKKAPRVFSTAAKAPALHIRATDRSPGIHVPQKG
jgi:hypothetical protein